MRNFTHPNLVKKSYLYRGTPPRIVINRHIDKTTFRVNEITGVVPTSNSKFAVGVVVVVSTLVGSPMKKVRSK